MLGRGCRSRGVCDGFLFVNTGEDEKTYLERLQVTKYSVTCDYIKFLNHLKKLQVNPFKTELQQVGKKSVSKTTVLPEVEALYKEWSQGNWLRSVKEL
jgi:hypothetical protein